MTKKESRKTEWIIKTSEEEKEEIIIEQLEKEKAEDWEILCERLGLKTE